MGARIPALSKMRTRALEVQFRQPTHAPIDVATGPSILQAPTRRLAMTGTQSTPMAAAVHALSKTDSHVPMLAAILQHLIRARVSAETEHWRRSMPTWRCVMMGILSEATDVRIAQ